MFYPVEGGSVIEINDNAFGFVYKCHVPPIGYGVNAITGKLESVGMPEENPVPEENYFGRYYLPKDWKQTWFLICHSFILIIPINIYYPNTHDISSN